MKKRKVTGFTIGFILYFAIASLLDFFEIDSFLLKSVVALIVAVISFLMDKYLFTALDEDKVI